MSDELDTSEAQAPDELTVLKARADRLGLTYHPSIGADKLKEKIRAHLAGAAPDTSSSNSAGDGEANSENTGDAQAAKPAAQENENQRRLRLRREANALVRVRVTCMNPMKKEWQGEVFTVSNAVVGTIKKYVPFNAVEWHVPQFMLRMLQDRMFQTFVTEKSSRGVDVRRGKLIKEFAIEVLDPLTEEELHDLAQRQAAAKSLGD